MSDNKGSKSGKNIKSKEDKSLDEKQPNLYQINEIMDEKRKEDMNTLLKKKKKKSESPDEISDLKKKKIIDGNYQDNENIPQDIQKGNISKPKAFIERYYDNTISKQTKSVEELEKNDLIIPKSMNLNPEIYKIILNGNELMKSMIEKEILDTKQRKDFNELISEIKKMDITKIIKEDKLDIIFDLENTCVYSFDVKIEDYMNLEQKYQEKNIKLFSIVKNEKIEYICLIIRGGLKEFINYAKPFCNFHISILDNASYGEAVKNKLEKEFDIKFIKFKSRKDNNTKKYLEQLDLTQKNCVIFDDFPTTWIKDELNVIISKRYIENDYFWLQNEMENKQNFNFEVFLSNYLPFFNYKYEKNENGQINLKKLKIYSGRLKPFYEFKATNNMKASICYTGESLESPKKQFIYMKEVIKIIYFFVFYYNIHVPDIIKFIRYNIFYKNYFNLKFYKGEGKNILIDTIETCGGEVFDEKNNNQDYKLFFVCRKDDYSELRDEIEKGLLIYENALVVSDKYIFDSFYFMTNLEDELNDPEYLIFNRNKENK